MKRVTSMLLMLMLCLAPMTALAYDPDFSAIEGSEILSPGAKGELVEKLQRRLIELGYLDGEASGSYDAGTERAVAAFKAKNGFGGLNGDVGVATLLTQAALFGDGPLSASDEGGAATFGSGNYIIRNVSCDTSVPNAISAQFDVVNRDSALSIKSMSLYFWLTDLSGGVTTMSGSRYWMQWYYNMTVPPESAKTVSITLNTNDSEWESFAGLRCVVGEIGYDNGCVISTVNHARQPVDCFGYVLTER